MNALAAGALALLVITVPFEPRLYWPGAAVTESTSFDVVVCAPPFHSSLQGKYSRLLLRDEPGVARRVVGRVA